ncbi:flavin-containing monooxygenase [Mycobacterium sp. NPDC048908]|uniref:flavin-containing monooxygenase n=1 Tax=Mycobacterium sp. NPDC048908 TaxID=3364292 RepID=UPI003711C515
MNRVDEKAPDREPVVIIGAGPAGIAAAASLCELGVSSLLIDRASELASSWRNRYDCLKLDTNKWFSRLPGRPYPKHTPMFPSREQAADYYELHAQAPAIRLSLNTSVERLDPLLGGDWRLQTSNGLVDARHVVIATGRAQIPVLPRWSGLDTYTGDFLHSSTYRSPKPYAGKRVLVVGSGASGMDIAHDLARGGAARVWLAVRTPPNILLRSLFGVVPGDVLLRPLFRLRPTAADAILRTLRLLTVGDLADVGLPIPPMGPFAAAHQRAISPSIVDKEVVHAIRRGQITIVSNVAAIETATVSLVDGTQLEPEVLIAATGYRTGLEPLVGNLDVLDDSGAPRAMAPEPAARGLWFIGYQLGPTALGIAGQQSRPLAREIADDVAAHEKRKTYDARTRTRP